jgi:hypothetical protein
LANGVIWVQNWNAAHETAFKIVVGLITLLRQALGGSNRLKQSCAVELVIWEFVGTALNAPRFF